MSVITISPRGVMCPATPLFPPSDDDILRTVLYSTNVMHTYDAGGVVMVTQVKEVFVQQANVISQVTHPDIVFSQPWFRVFKSVLGSHFDNIGEHFDGVGEHFDGVGEHFDVQFEHIGEQLDAIMVFLQQLHEQTTMTANCQRCNGSLDKLQEMSFPNHQLSTQAPHNLPLLCDLHHIESLTDGQLFQYVVGYYPGTLVPTSRNQCISLIHEAVGC